MGRADFEDEAVGALRNLGYSESEISATAGSLPMHLGTEERLRQSLRALNDVHTEKVQAPFEADRLKQSAGAQADSAYNEGLKSGERNALKRMSQSQREAKARTPRQPRQKSEAMMRREAMAPVRNFGKLAKLAKGKRR